MQLFALIAVAMQMSVCLSFKMQMLPSSRSRNTLTSLRASDQADYALLFDCDGVIVETEVGGVRWTLMDCVYLLQLIK